MRVYVIVEGGIVQSVCSDEEGVECIIIDYDANEDALIDDEPEPNVWSVDVDVLNQPLSDDIENGGREYGFLSEKEKKAIKELRELGL